MTTAVDYKARLANTGQEYRDLIASDAGWIARSAHDVVAIRAAEQDGVFGKLPAPDFEAFLSGLEFEHGGLCSGYYKALMPSLSLTEIFEVFERFGMGRDLFLRTLEAKCVGGTCEFSFWSFCSSLCEQVVEH